MLIAAKCVGPHGFEPWTLCSDSYRKSQLFLYLDINLLTISGYFFKFCI
jgi:hypothetical protein